MLWWQISLLLRRTSLRSMHNNNNSAVSRFHGESPCSPRYMRPKEDATRIHQLSWTGCRCTTSYHKGQQLCPRNLGTISETFAKFSFEDRDMMQINYPSHYHMVTWAPWRLKTPTTRLFVQQGGIKVNIKFPHHWPFVRGFHRSPVESPHKGPVMRKAFPCHGAIMFKS